MDELQFNDIYSSLNKSSQIIIKVLSTMKEKNESFNQKVKELESTISSILQRTITKEEMKEMIKEGLTPIVDILLGKEIRTEKVSTVTQTENELIEEKGKVQQIKIASKEEKIQQIKFTEEIMQSEELTTYG